MTLQICGSAIRRMALVVVYALAPSIASAQPVERSFEEFLAAQGTFCLPDGLGGCILMNSSLPNTFIFQDSDGTHCAFVDYAGLASKYLAEASSGAIALGTAIRGSVREVAFPDDPDTTIYDGWAELTVALSADNALIWIVEGCDLANGHVVFGSNVNQILQGSKPTLGSAMLRTKLRMNRPGDPLPDLFQVLAWPAYPQVFYEITFTAHASSELHGHASVLHKSNWVAGGLQYHGPIQAEMIIMR